VNSTQTDPYRWDFDITYTYGDNRTNMGSTFTLNLVFDTGVFYTDVPIWWKIYPITNEVMSNRWIDVAYSGVPDLNPMSYPSGSWTIPSQPSPYDSFWIRFSRVTGTTETLVRTDSWHVTVATYDFQAPAPTATVTLTSIPTSTPTIVPTTTPVNCYGSTCNGLNPNSMGCDYDAQTYSNYRFLYDANNDLIGVVENRFSIGCLSQWERTRNTSGISLYGEGSIRWGGIDYTPFINPVSGHTSSIEGWVVYTAMYGVDGGLGPSLNCGSLSTSSVDPPPQPINLNSPYGLNNCAAR
jgi:hypothetical protein